MQGTSKKHGKAVGYIVVNKFGHPTIACHGFGDAKTALLCGVPITLYRTRKLARRAITEDGGECHRILRVAYLE